MKTLRLTGHIDANHRLHAEVPPDMVPGKVQVLVVLPPDEEDEAGAEWAAGIAREWGAELNDPREDIYTLRDGDPPTHGAR